MQKLELKEDSDIKAKYIGEDFEVFRKGKVYDIVTRCDLVTGKGIKKPTPCLIVQDTASLAWCPYSRLEPMLKNWELLD